MQKLINLAVGTHHRFYVQQRFKVKKWFIGWEAGRPEGLEARKI